MAYPAVLLTEKLMSAFLSGHPRPAEGRLAHAAPWSSFQRQSLISRAHLRASPAILAARKARQTMPRLQALPVPELPPPAQQDDDLEQLSSSSSSSVRSSSTAGAPSAAGGSSSSGGASGGSSEGEGEGQGQPVVIDLELPRRSLLVGFTCNLCGGRTERLVNPVAWQKGMVIAQCEGCQAWHKLADAANLVEEIRYTSDDE